MGYAIRHTNWKEGSYELDMVAQKGDVLAVVEVKTRERDDYGDPSEAVTLKKIRRMVAAADFYVKFFKIDLPVRFDIVSVVGQGEERRIEHIPDAFYPPLG